MRFRKSLLTALLGLGLAVLVLGGFVTPASAFDGLHDSVAVEQADLPPPIPPDCPGVHGEIALSASAGGVTRIVVAADHGCNDALDAAGPCNGPTPDDSHLFQRRPCPDGTGNGRDSPEARL